VKSPNSCPFCDYMSSEMTNFCPNCGVDLTEYRKNSETTAEQARNDIIGFDFKCPVCKSDNIKRLPIAYKEGLSAVNLNSSGGGIGIGSGGIGVGLAGFSTKGSQQTELSISVSPPAKSSPSLKAGYRIVAAILMFLIGVFLVAADTPGTKTAGGLIIVVGIVLFFIGGSNDSIDYEIRQKNWENSFICLRCGHIHCPNPEYIKNC